MRSIRRINAGAALADQVRNLRPGAKAAMKPVAKKKASPQKKTAVKKPAVKKAVKKAAKKK